jgi:hypothetical protein
MATLTSSRSHRAHVEDVSGRYAGQGAGASVALAAQLDDRAYSIRGIAEKEVINASYVSRILRLALLAPDIVEEILAGRVADDVVLEQFKKPIPAGWDEQRKILSRSTPGSKTSFE